MHYRRNSGITIFSIGLVVLLSLSLFFGAEVMGKTGVSSASSETALEIVPYEGLKPDEFMKTWLVLGPIAISPEGQIPDQEAQERSFDLDFLDECGGELQILPQVGLSCRIKDESYSWQQLQTKQDIVDLADTFEEKEFAVAYLWAEIEVPESKKVLLGIGSDDGVKIWVNGELVHRNWIARPVSLDEDLVAITLNAGCNQLLLKVQNSRSGWGFSCRMLGHQLLSERLVSAGASGNLEAMELLLSHGAEINTTVDPGLTALHLAKIRGWEDAVHLLLEKGADPNIEMPAPNILVDALFERAIEADSSGVAVLVAQDGKILYQKGFGLANIEHDVPVIPEAKFRIGSITKQFTASAILKLREEGLLSLDDPLSKFLPDFPRGNEVTIHHLLTHTSGIHSYTNKTDFYQTVGVEIEPEELIDSFKNDPFDFEPGEDWLYNNSGYFLLGYIVQKVSGESLGDFLKKNFFEPLGMKETGVHHWSLILEHEASGYSYVGGEFRKARRWDMSRAGGAGALYSTVGDLYLWNEAVFNGKVLSNATLEAAFTPVRLNDGSLANALGAEYGYGWMLSEIRGLKEIAHSGGFDGFAAYLARYPAQKLTVAVLTNALPPPPGLVPGTAVREIAEIYLWEEMSTTRSVKPDTEIDTSVYEDYVGRYDYVQAILTVTKEEYRLFAQTAGQPKFELSPRSETEFYWKEADAHLTFVRDEDGEVAHIIHRQAGQEFKALKLKEESLVEVDPSIYDAYVGEYDYGAGMILTVTKEDDRLFAQMTGQSKSEIFARSETEFYWKIVNAQITFVRDETGKVVKAIHQQGGARFEVEKIK